MIAFLFSLVFAVLALMFRALYKTYEHVPARELKRMARSGDDVAVLMYRPVAYGMSLKLFLGLFVILFGAASLALMVQAVGPWLAVLVLLATFVVGALAIVPGAELTKRSVWLAGKFAPVLSWVLERIQPVLDAIARFVQKHRPVRVHTGLYEKADLVELLEQQKGQADSRVSSGEIDMLVHALSFGDRYVSEILVPKRVVKSVATHEAVGPILMADLHKSGHSRFPVYEGTHDNVVGMLYLHDLVAAKQTGTVAEVMKHRLLYVHEDFTLYDTLQAFLKTKHHLFLVVNSFEEYVGIITIEDILEQMIGKPIVDEFDAYDDLRAVAAQAAHHEHTARTKDHAEPVLQDAATTEPPEVIK